MASKLCVSAMRADRIVGILQTAGRPVPVPELADLFYGFDPDGGPLGAEAVMRLSVHAMRARGDERVRTTRAGYGLSDWPDRLEWHQARRVWDGRLLDHVERLALMGLTHDVIGERIGKTANDVSVALVKARRTCNTKRRAA